MPSQHIAQREVHRIVEHRRHARIDTIESPLAAGEKRSHARIRMINLTDRREPRIDSLERRVPARPENARHVGKSIDAKSVEPRGFGPPDRVLLQVRRDDRIFRIQIGQHSEKPSIRQIAPQIWRSMWIGHRLEGIVPESVLFRFAVKRGSRRNP